MARLVIVPCSNDDCSAVKRILQEAKELAQDACYEYEAHPREVIVLLLCVPLRSLLREALFRTTFSTGTLLFVVPLIQNLQAASRCISISKRKSCKWPISHNCRYHGRILIPAEYPFKPPELMFLTVGISFGGGKNSIQDIDMMDCSCSRMDDLN